MTNIKLYLSPFLFITTAPIHGMLLTCIKNPKHQPIAPRRNLSLVPLKKNPNYLIALEHNINPTDKEFLLSQHAILYNPLAEDPFTIIKYTHLTGDELVASQHKTGFETVIIPRFRGITYFRPETIYHSSEILKRAQGQEIQPLTKEEIRQLFSSIKKE